MDSSDGALILKTHGDFPNCSLAQRAQDAKNKPCTFCQTLLARQQRPEKCRQWNQRHPGRSPVAGARKRCGIIVGCVRVGVTVRQLLWRQCTDACGRFEKWSSCLLKAVLCLPELHFCLKMLSNRKDTSVDERPRVAPPSLPPPSHLPPSRRLTDGASLADLRSWLEHDSHKKQAQQPCLGSKSAI